MENTDFRKMKSFQQNNKQLLQKNDKKISFLPYVFNFHWYKLLQIPKLN